MSHPSSSANTQQQQRRRPKAPSSSRRSQPRYGRRRAGRRPPHHHNAHNHNPCTVLLSWNAFTANNNRGRRLSTLFWLVVLGVTLWTFKDNVGRTNINTVTTTTTTTTRLSSNVQSSLSSSSSSSSLSSTNATVVKTNTKSSSSSATTRPSSTVLKKHTEEEEEEEKDDENAVITSEKEVASVSSSSLSSSTSSMAPQIIQSRNNHTPATATQITQTTMNVTTKTTDPPSLSLPQSTTTFHHHHNHKKKNQFKTLLQVPFYVYDEINYFSTTIVTRKNQTTATFYNTTISDLISAKERHTWKHADDLWFWAAALRHPLRTRNPARARLFVVPALLNLVVSHRIYKHVCVQHIPASSPLLVVPTKGGDWTENQNNHSIDSDVASVVELCDMDWIQAVNDYLATQSPWFAASHGTDHVVVATTHAAPLRLRKANDDQEQQHPNRLDALLSCHMIAVEDMQWHHPARLALPSYYVGTPCPVAASSSSSSSSTKTADFAMVATLKSRPTFDARRRVCAWTTTPNTDHADHQQHTTTNFTWTICGPGPQCPALAQAKFGFHVRGDTYGANRLMDSILTGTVPIFTQREQYDVLPDWIDWSQLSYFVNVDTRNATQFRQDLRRVLDDHEGYQMRLQRIAENRDLFDWTRIGGHNVLDDDDDDYDGSDVTGSPFDTYMYQLASQLYPETRRPNSESPFSALYLSPPTSTTLSSSESETLREFRAFNHSVKMIWCGDAGPAHHCGLSPKYLGSFRLGCTNMCIWCEYGLQTTNSTDTTITSDADIDDDVSLLLPNPADPRWTQQYRSKGLDYACAPSYYQCKEPDWETLMQNLVRPFPVPPALRLSAQSTATKSKTTSKSELDPLENLCFSLEDPEDARVRGFLAVTPNNTIQEYTATAVTRQIATRLGRRRRGRQGGKEQRQLTGKDEDIQPSSSPCLYFAGRVFSKKHKVATAKTSSISWAIVMDPAAWVRSALVHERANSNANINREKDDLQFIAESKHHQFIQLRRPPSSSAWSARVQAHTKIPQTYVDLTAVFQDEIFLYDFVAVAERLEESLVTMRLLWGLRDGDIMVPLIEEQESGWLPTEDETCIHVEPNQKSTTQKVEKYLRHDFEKDNHDYVLYEWANRTLDKTIEKLGKAKVEAERKRFRQLQKKLQQKCQWNGPCDNENGNWQPLDEECIHKILDKYEADASPPAKP